MASHNFGEMVKLLRQTFNSGKTKPVQWRVAQLTRLRDELMGRQDQIVQAMKLDLGRCKAEAIIAEIAATVGDIDFLIANVASWVKPTSVSQPLTQQPGSSKVYKLPKGVVLVIGPWNYPFNNVIGPFASVLSAGNCAIVKPSELSPNCSRIIEEIVNCLDKDAFKVVQGAVDETTALLKEPFDHIMYTGNGAVAKVVMKAAAEHLTPVTLELGGKSPVIVDSTAKIPILAKRVCWGKFLNNGQTCIAPDYMLVTADVKDQVVEAFKATIKQFYTSEPHDSPDLGRIVNTRHWDRVQSLLAAHGGTAWTPGTAPANRDERYIPPTLVLDPAVDSKIMTEEIFGPVLPIITVHSVDEAIAFVNARPRPLALYVFTETSAEKVLAETTSGGACVNEVLFHNVNPNLPFGGVGPSGTGAYHGVWGFQEFSHKRAVLFKPTWFDMKERYPPYNDATIKFLMKLLVGPLLPPAAKHGLTAAALVTVAFLLQRVARAFM